MANCTCPKCSLLAKVDMAMATEPDPEIQAHVLGEFFAGVTLLAENKAEVIAAFHTGNTKAWKDIIADCEDGDPEHLHALIAEYVAVKQAIEEHIVPDPMPHRLN